MTTGPMEDRGARRELEAPTFPADGGPMGRTTALRARTSHRGPMQRFPSGRGRGREGSGGTIGNEGASAPRYTRRQLLVVDDYDYYCYSATTPDHELVCS
jgi:hypothetical protein